MKVLATVFNFWNISILICSLNSNMLLEFTHRGAEAIRKHLLCNFYWDETHTYVYISQQYPDTLFCYPCNQEIQKASEQVNLILNAPRAVLFVPESYCFLICSGIAPGLVFMGQETAVQLSSVQCITHQFPDLVGCYARVPRSSSPNP